MGESNKCLEAPRGSTFPSEADAANIFFPAFPSFSAFQMTCRIAIIVAKAFPAKHTHTQTYEHGRIRTRFSIFGPTLRP